MVTAAAASAGPLVAAALLGGRCGRRRQGGPLPAHPGGAPGRGDGGRAAESSGVAHYRRAARTDVRERLEWHRARGHRLVIVSASPESYLAPVGDDLGVDAVVATRLDVGPDGRLTGDYDGRNCRGAEKLARVRRLMAQWTADGTVDTTGASAISAVLWAYGNSDGDRQLLAGADVGVDVGRLGRLGSLRAFPRLTDLLDGDDGDGHHPGGRKPAGG